MKIFESFKDIGDSGKPISTQLVAAKLLCGLIKACLDGNGSYDPEDDGRVVLIEETDTEEMIEDLLGRVHSLMRYWLYFFKQLITVYHGKTEQNSR